MQLLKAKTGKIIHHAANPDYTGDVGVCPCGKGRMIPKIDEETAAQTIEKGGAYCEATLAAMEPDSATSDETRWVTEPKTLADLSPADIKAIKDSATDQLHAYQRIVGDHAKKVRGYRLQHKAKKPKRQRTRSAKRGASWGVHRPHARIAGLPKAPASLYTHRAFLDPNGIMSHQPIGGGKLVLSRPCDRSAVRLAMSLKNPPALPEQEMEFC